MYKELLRKYTKEYSLYSAFDMNEHKKKYVNYLEVIIDERGKIYYATPSHTIKLEELVMEKLNLSSIYEVKNLCPVDMYCSYMDWLLSESKCIAVWDTLCKCDSINRKQYLKLKLLKINGLYHGPIPKYN